VVLPTDPADRAIAAWNLLVADHAGRTVLRRPVLHEKGSRRQVTLWPYSQVMHARALVRGLRPVDVAAAGSSPTAPPAADLAPLLHRYSFGSAFVDRPGGQHRYVDDNAWVALAQWQHRMLLTPGVDPSREALDLLGWLAARVDGDGGVVWREDGTSRHACSTGATGVALALGRAVGSPAHVAALRCASFLNEVLVDDDGLVRDNIDADGRIEQTRWIYNQALFVRLETALAGLAESDLTTLERLDRADAAIAAGLDHFDAERLWQQPVAFVAIWVRAVLARGAAGPRSTISERAESSVALYTERLVGHLNRHEGRIGHPDLIGRYANGESDVLDRAAAVQVLALAALPQDEHSAIA
jgi:hypothetical protein